MKSKMPMIIFFTVVFLVHFSVNYFIFKHSKPLFEIDSWVGLALKILFIVLVLSYPVGRVLERAVPSATAEFIAKVGAFWLGAMVYLFLIFLLFNIVKLVFNYTGFPAFMSLKSSSEFLKRFAIGVYGVTAIILIAGYFNALYPRVNNLKILVDKEVEGYDNLRIGVASDIHLGTIITNGRLERFVRMMNSQNPDIILLAGDIFDEDLGPVIQNDMGSLLSRLNAPLGVFAVTGNHEYIGGVDPAVKYLEKHGIRVVRDTTLSLNGVVNIVGREDRQSKVMGGYKRKALDDIVANIDKNLLTILLDHQPFNLNEAVENGIDLQISGHTHHGQMFPFNFITRAMFEVSRGHKQIEDTHIFVSTGFGTWGPPIRVGNRPEIAIIDVKSK